MDLGGIPTIVATPTNIPSTTTLASSTPRPSNSTKAFPISTKWPLTSTRKSSTSSNRLATSNNKYSSSATTETVVDDKGQNKYASKQDNTLGKAIIALAVIVGLVLIILTSFCVYRFRKRRAISRDSVLHVVSMNENKASNAYFKDPTVNLGFENASRIHQNKRPLPEVPSDLSASGCKRDSATISDDLRDILRKQSLAIPASFSDPTLWQPNQINHEASACSLPAMSVRCNQNADLRASSIKDDHEDDGNFTGSYISMRPIPGKIICNC